MELNITDFFENARPSYYSASYAELGDDAGRITWENSLDAADQYPDWLDTEGKRDAFRAYVRTLGAWTEEEIVAWTDSELTALLIQIVSGDIRESGLQDGKTWEEYEAQSEAGQVSGNLWRGETGEIYYYVGN